MSHKAAWPMRSLVSTTSSRLDVMVVFQSLVACLMLRSLFEGSSTPRATITKGRLMITLSYLLRICRQRDPR